MNKIIVLFFLFISSSVCSQDNNCKDLKNGIFELYEGSKKNGTIYRKNGFQLEKYLTSKQYFIVKIIPKGKCLLYMKSYTIEEDLDTITWAVNYSKIKNKHYSFIGKAVYLNIGYRNSGELKKISNDIKDKEILDLFDELEKRK